MTSDNDVPCFDEMEGPKPTVLHPLCTHEPEQALQPANMRETG
jgi:hypothetical protein